MLFTGSFVKESGEEYIQGFSVGFISYLIFELANGDIRSTLVLSNALDYAWYFNSLHDVAVGIKQLHAIDVTHQDLKPSNILVYDKKSKLCDLGRSVCSSMDGPYNKLEFTGDRSYAPPEIWYGYHEENWKERVFATDCYMLGSLIVFYFSKISMSAMLNNYIPKKYQWSVWEGSFQEIAPYLNDAFSNALNEFEANIKDEYFKKELRQIVEYLCNPFPNKRGHPMNRQLSTSKYGMERFISKLNLLKHKAEIAVKKN